MLLKLALRTRTVVFVCMSSLLLLYSAGGHAQSTRYALAPTTDISHIVVKYREGTDIRLRQGQLVSQAGRALPAGISSGILVAEMAEVESIAKSRGFEIKRVFESVSESKAASLRSAGQARLKTPLSDLNLFHAIHLPAQSNFQSVEPLLYRLNELSIVEIAYAQPVPEPGTHLDTPDFEPDQGYLGPAPGGVDAEYAWTLPGGRGQGVSFVDVEGAWRTTHEDLPALFFDSGNHIDDIDWRDHGTAVLGVIGGLDNGDGVTGISNQAAIGVSSIFVNNEPDTANAIMEAANEVGPGGVVLIELHAEGPDDGPDCTCNREYCHYIPMEYWPAEFAAVQTATANGVIVVAIAGNGSVDLDADYYEGAFDRNQRDSGAILVGASRSFARTPTCWTNFGDRVDVHGWGEDVVTLGYGDLFDGGHNEEDRFYRATFSGTSSASAIVAGSVASLQGIAMEQGLGQLDSVTMRQVLASTGTAQTGDLDRNIGPLPDLRSAVENINIITPSPSDDLAWLPAVIGLLLN